MRVGVVRAINLNNSDNEDDDDDDALLGRATSRVFAFDADDLLGIGDDDFIELGQLDTGASNTADDDAIDIDTFLARLEEGRTAIATPQSGSKADARARQRSESCINNDRSQRNNSFSQFHFAFEDDEEDDRVDDDGDDDDGESLSLAVVEVNRERSRSNYCHVDQRFIIGLQPSQASPTGTARTPAILGLGGGEGEETTSAAAASSLWGNSTSQLEKNSISSMSNNNNSFFQNNNSFGMAARMHWMSQNNSNSANNNNAVDSWQNLQNSRDNTNNNEKGVRQSPSVGFSSNGVGGPKNFTHSQIALSLNNADQHQRDNDENHQNDDLMPDGHGGFNDDGDNFAVGDQSFKHRGDPYLRGTTNYHQDSGHNDDDALSLVASSPLYSNTAVSTRITKKNKREDTPSPSTLTANSSSQLSKGERK